MANYNFNKDLDASAVVEHQLADIFIAHGYTVQFNNDNRYDLLVEKNGVTHTVEIKINIVNKSFLFIISSKVL